MGGGGRKVAMQWVVMADGSEGGEKERRGVRGEREITVIESENEKERAHENPNERLRGENILGIYCEREKFWGGKMEKIVRVRGS